MSERIGQQLGNYRLVRLIGRGGFAHVYLGEHIYLKTFAAIKVLQLQLSAEDRDNFLAEARTIAHLIHPHIVRVLDFGVDAGTPYLVMDYAPNGTLREQFPKGAQLPLPTVMPALKQVGSALQYAHNRNLIHRDVKPGNFLVAQNNEVLLSDFGIALVVENSRSQTTEDTVVGTVAYMAPEQISGKPRPASDQYSLAIVVYEWLCGERPFQGSFAEIVTQQMTTPPPPLRAKVPTISPDVEEAVMVALAKDPHDRFATVDAFVHALEQASAVEQRTVSRSLPISEAQPVHPVPIPVVSVPPTRPATGPTHHHTQITPSTQPMPARSIPPQHNAPSLNIPPQSQQMQQMQQVPQTSQIPARRALPFFPGSMSKAEKQEKSRQKQLTRITATLIGTILFGALTLLAQYTTTLTTITLVGNLTIALLVGCLASATLPFFGASFGPLVGLLTGLLGTFIADYGSAYLLPGHHHPATGWLWYLGSAIIGVLTGLIARATFNKRRSTPTLLIIDLIGACGVNLGFMRLLGGSELASALILTIACLHAFQLIYNSLTAPKKTA